MNIWRITSEDRWLVVLCLVFLVLGVFRLNDLSLYTDSTRYVIWGTSFAQVRGLVDNTQPDPERYIVNAPLYSVFLSPILLFFPHSLAAAKIWTLLWGLGFLIAFYAFLKRLLGTPMAILGLLPLVFNPLFLLISTEVLSESSFLALVFLTFLLTETLADPERASSRQFVTLLVIVSALILLREVAVALVGAALLHFIARKEYKRAAAILVGVLLFFGAWLFRNLVLVGTPPASQATNVSFFFEHFVTPPTAPLVQEIALRVVNNANGYAIHAGGMLFYPLPEVLIVEPSDLFRAYFRVLVVAKYIVPVLFVPLFVLGVWRDLKQHQAGLARILFLIAYAAIILVYPIHDVRFLLPLLPLFIFYALVACRWILATFLKGAHRSAKYTAIVFSFFVALPNALCMFEILHTNVRYTSDPLKFYEHLRSAGLMKNIFTKPWKLMGDQVEANTEEHAVIASALKEASIFIGDRKLLELNNAVPVTTFDHYLRDFAVDHLLSTSSWDDFRSYDFQMAESRRFWFEPVSRIAGMQLFRVHLTNISPKEDWLHTKRVPIDTVTGNGLLRKGRSELLRRQYADAVASLKKAQQLAPTQAMIAYQLTVALAMSGRLEEATAQLQRLFGFAQSSTYTPIATRMLAICQAASQAQRSNNPMQRALVLYDVATFYWNLGYYNEAYALMRQILQQDSTYFTGLLWGWHYAIQMSDTSQARLYLRHLEAVDRSNPVVREFRAITLSGDSLRRASSPIRRCELRLRIARSYEAVDLPEEAIDEAQRAVRENPSSAEPWLFQARLFEKRKALRAAQSAYRQVLKLEPGNPEAARKINYD